VYAAEPQGTHGFERQRPGTGREQDGEERHREEFAEASDRVRRMRRGVQRQPGGERAKVPRKQGDRRVGHPKGLVVEQRENRACRAPIAARASAEGRIVAKAARLSSARSAACVRGGELGRK